MRSLSPTICSVLMCLTMSCEAGAFDEVSSRDVEQLISNLGSRDYDTRKSATAELKQSGETAVAAVKDAANSQDVEVSRRCLLILEFWMKSENQSLESAANSALKELESSEKERVSRAARFARRDAPEYVVARLKKLGARFDYRQDNAVTGVDLSRQGVNNRDVASLRSFKEIETIDLNYTEISSGVLSAFRKFSHLRELRLRCACLVDEDLRYLQGLSNLQRLNLWRTGISDGGVAHLTDLNQLEELNLGHNDISDEGLKHISHLKNLTRLTLIKTDITDLGLHHLASLRHLKFLNVKGTRVTLSGIQHLKQECPDLEIRYGREQNEACPKRHGNRSRPLSAVDSGTSDRLE